MIAFDYSQAGFDLTRNSEGLRLEAYQDSVGVWTIGYGHTGHDVHPGLQITAQQANDLLEQDVQFAVNAVNRAVTAAITQNQFDAMVDFCFNLGSSALLGSTLLHMVNEGDFAGAAGQFGLWIYAKHQVQPGLVRRRAAESALFQEPESQPSSAAASLAK